MAKIRVEHQKDLCIGCGACAAIDPEHWEMDGDKSKLKDAQKQDGSETEYKIFEESNVGANQEAADACPVPCIFIKKEE